MATKIQSVESYYQTFINKGVYILPYAITILIIIQLISRKIKFYLNAQWNQFIDFVNLLLNCTIENEIENSNSHEVAHIANFNADRCNIVSSDTDLGLGLNSSRNATRDFDESVSDIEILRGDSDDETNNPKIRSIAEEVQAKTALLQKKRQDLCGQLLAYKLMEFQIDTPLGTSILNVPNPLKSKSQSPLPYAEEINFQTPPTPTSQPQAQPFIPEYEESYEFTSEDMLARAIQASLDDVASKAVHDSNLTPPREDSTFAKLPGESSTETAKIPTASPHSPGKISRNQSTPSRFIENNPHIPPRFIKNNNPNMPSPVINLMDMWNKNYAQDIEKDAEQPNTRQEDSENVVIEDFMEGDRYVGDKGKRPLSGRYAYKKRSKPFKSVSEEPGPSTSGDVPKEDSAAE